MKKLLLVAIAACIGFGANAQERIQVSKDLLNVTKKADNKSTNDEFTPYVGTITNNTVSSAVPEENIFGDTYYDLQSNGVIGERAYMTEDGEMAAVWTRGMDESSGWADRGTGYNYFDGTAWGPMPDARIESVKTGWPSIAQYMDGEVITCHGLIGGGYTDLGIMTRPVRGEGDWTVKDKPGTLTGVEYVWNRVATSGDNKDIIHVISNSYNPYNGQDMAVTYNRTKDGGDTWDMEDVILDGMGPDSYFELNADVYKIVTRGNTVVIAAGGPWHDLFFLKSLDNGDNWEKTVVWENEYSLTPYEDIYTDSAVWCPDRSLDVAIDSESNVHLTFGLGRVLKEETGPDSRYSTYPWVDGVVYWNESMDPFYHETEWYNALNYDNLEENVNLIGWAQDIDGDGELTYTEAQFPHTYREFGFSTMPTIAVNDNDDIMIVWASTTEHRTWTGEEELNLKQLFGRRTFDGVWSEDIRFLTESLLHSWDECIYPVFFGLNGDKFDFFYNLDTSIGLLLDEDHSGNENKMVHFTDTWVGVENIAATNINIGQNYPNPVSNGVTHFEVTVGTDVNANITVVNMVGQVVYTQTNELTAGNTNIIELPTRNLNSGMYFYTVSVGAEKVSRKMIVE